MRFAFAAMRKRGEKPISHAVKISQISVLTHYQLYNGSDWLEWFKSKVHAYVPYLYPYIDTILHT